MAHRALEDDTLRLLDHLATVPGAPVVDTTVTEALAAAAFLGDDQRDAVRTLCGSGGSVRAVLAPAGFGKTAPTLVAAGTNLASDER